MSKENNKMQVDIDTLKKQNVNDLLSIKELYRKLKEVEEKITQFKYIDNALVKKLKKEYENLNKIILDENIQVKLSNDIKSIKLQLDKIKDISNIETINSKLDNMTKQNVEKTIKRNKNDYFGCYGISLIGDSISYGFSVNDITNDSYGGILRKMFMFEHDTENYGNVSLIQSGGDSNGTYKTIHERGSSSDWKVEGQSTNVNRFTLTSTTKGGYITFKVPTITKGFNILYNKLIDGGVLEVYLNEVKIGEINTSSTSEKYDSLSNFFAFNTSLKIQNIKLVKKDTKKTTICGIMYMNSFNEKCFNLFAKSGEKLTTLDNSVLDRVSMSDILIMALGHNDMASGAQNLPLFKQKINYLIERCNYYNTFVVVPDFCWYKENETQINFKNELKRLADETKGIYIDFSRVLNSNDSESWINNGLLIDWSHPTVLGHKIIAETIARELGLMKTSKTAKLTTGTTGTTDTTELENKVTELENKINKKTQFINGTNSTGGTLVNNLSFLKITINDGTSTCNITIPNSMKYDGNSFEFTLTKWDASVVKFINEDGSEITQMELGNGKYNGYYKAIYLASVGNFRYIKLSDSSL